MKRIFLLLIFLLLLFPLASADTTGSKSETVRLSLTVRNVVYVGVTDSAISSSIVPDSNLGVVRFSFNPYDKVWRTSNAYLYVISFVKDKVQVTLTPSHLANTATSTNTIPYTATVSSMTSNSDCNSFEFKSTGSAYTSSSSAFVVGTSRSYGTLVKESGPDGDSTKNYTEPRVMSWEFQMEIDAAGVTPLASEYKAVYTMTISAVT